MLIKILCTLLLLLIVIQMLSVAIKNNDLIRAIALNIMMILISAFIGINLIGN